MKIEIFSRLDGSVLFSIETESLKLAIEAAVTAGANLAGAYLAGANGIDKFPVQIVGHKHFLQTTQSGDLRIGCHVRTFEEWERTAEAAGRAEGYSDIDIEIYKLHIAHIAQVARLLWNLGK